jgi:sulfoxide reductase heme-binding subunit YedZ
VRHDLFGAANYTGAISVLILIALLATSNDLSLRAFGTARWKQLQRWNYAVFGFAAIHSIAYLAIEKQKLQWVTTVMLCIAIALSLQIAGFARRRSQAFKRS